MIANITTLSGLTGTATSVGTIERGPVNNSVPTVVDEPIPGFIRQIKLSPEGVTIVHAGRAVRIPLPLLIALAAQVDPAISPAGRAVASGEGESVNPVNPVNQVPPA